MSVWLAATDTEPEPSCRNGCCRPVSTLLARHLITTCTRLGGLVIDIDAADHAVVSSALTTGCRAVATFSDPARAHHSWQALKRLHPRHDLEVADLRLTPADATHQTLTDLLGTADLVIAKRHCRQSEQVELSHLAALVKPGGHLAVITGLHRAGGHVHDPAPDIIHNARHAELTYLQHIIALHVPVRGGRLEPPPTWRVPAPDPATAGCAGLPISTRLHTDVLIFTKPRRSPRVADLPTENAGGDPS
ncbi:hypothetical protein C1I98_33430 [Spongiactinospora gelatinilytica]|uniref:SAM-dependent methyltransferase n=1 Tax=Spongiactinospora gelatinilytica TaxID=2666298 RepID=A0A2W2EWA6_9ACTN|nr:hypothetical protein [Spongiactinospora gelatinilytica]PZG27301.1 hypothetical protein C1I98_33430 [Spongiactinospora gelatinilytica]